MHTGAGIITLPDRIEKFVYWVKFFFGVFGLTLYEVNKKLPIKRARKKDNDDDDDDEDEDGRARSREKRDVPRATLEAFYAICCCCLVSSEPRKNNYQKQQQLQ